MTVEVSGLYSDFGPIFKQILYTSAELSIQPNLPEVTALSWSS